MTAAARDDGFRRVLAAEGVSNFGAMLSRLAIPWIAALMLDVTPLQMGLLVVADIAAGAVGSLLLGAVVDRSRKRVVMLLADGLRCVLLAALALLAWAGALNFGLLLLAGAANGLLTMAFELARSAWIAQRVAAEQLSTRNSQLAMTGSLSETAAFAAGGWVFQAFGGVVALALDALSYLLSALCLRGVPEAAAAQAQAPPPRGAWRGFVDDTLQGLRAVAARPALRALAGIEVLLALTMALTGTCYTIFVARDIGFGTGVLGLVAAAGGAGAVAGAALAPLLGRRLGPGRTMALGLGGFSLGALCIPLVAAPGALGLLLLVAHQVVGDAGHTLHDVHDRTLRQTAVPPELLARADAGIRAAGQGAALLGALGGGWLAGVTGTRTALLLAAALAAAAALLAALTLARRR